MRNSVLVGFFQFEPEFGNVRANIAAVEESISAVDADLIVLPELFNTGYQFISREEAYDLSEEVPTGRTAKHLIDIASAKNMHIIAGMAERSGNQIFNSAVLVDPSGIVSVYRKTHLFDEETLWFAPGDTGFAVHDIGKARIGIMVCFDWLFPEAARTLALNGAQIICHPSNLVLGTCEEAMITRCLENRVFAITANRVGTEERGGKPSLHFTGRSQVVGPKGTRLCSAGPEESVVKIVEIDPTAADDKRVATHSNLFSQRQPDFYKF
jgi:predicted amidohydrolase